MSVWHRMAERRLDRKYGKLAQQTMPNWGKVYARLHPRMYEVYNQRMLWVAMVTPALAVTPLASFLVSLTLR